MAFAGNVDELALLQTVRLKKQVTAEVIAAHLGVSVAAGQAAVAALLEQGKASENGGGISLTDKGTSELNDQLDGERVSIDEDSISELYDQFLPLDEELNTLLENADADGFVDGLIDLDRRAQSLFDDVSAFVPRLSRYQDLFAEALEKVKGGSLAWATAANIDSYASVWGETRQEIAGAAGR
ncbi:hypothetical protein HBA53_20880 [Rhodococcus pyridinivorans]|uniref:hypothetical protein n=1 Tax=Rhodococcus pyridinivorans TaxID=103816 RepID=UPI001C2F0F1A|nr:hypothetical protein [Rhodococcus pyridinivorans]QXF83176.1 hypothetical protein HBA53_20880 [Rhodococcus pyridinivorans]